MALSDRFIKIRKYYGLSQPEFAQRINKTQGFVSNVETGKSDISPNTIHDLCALFNLNEEWLVSGEGDMFTEGHEVAEADKEGAGLRIRQVRKEEKLTQQEFADIIGYSKKQVYSVEAKITRPSNDFIRSVAYSFGVNYNWLMTGVGEKEAVETEVDERLIEWLRRNPDIVKELKVRSGLD